MANGVTSQPRGGSALCKIAPSYLIECPLSPHPANRDAALCKTLLTTTSSQLVAKIEVRLIIDRTEIALAGTKAECVKLGLGSYL